MCRSAISTSHVRSSAILVFKHPENSEIKEWDKPLSYTTKSRFVRKD